MIRHSTLSNLVGSSFSFNLIKVKGTRNDKVNISSAIKYISF